jgi:hypothetical protein
MKKRIIALMAIMMMSMAFVSEVKSQVFMLDYLEESESDRIGRPQIEGLDLPATPQLGITIDQYAPLGSGIVVLAALGGAYLLGKRRKEE